MAVNENNLKSTPIPVVSARMQIVNSDGTPTRSGMLLLQQMQQQNFVGYGLAGSADQANMPDGSYFTIEGDNDEILYQLQNGEWHYIAGTMWGTLNPDQRPQKLGPNDAGFDFRSIDSNTDYAPRQFIWSGHEWIETTLVLYGTHAARPPADERTPSRTLYVETDRTEVIYQQQANSWHYLAGTMWGTLSPDQRPTDLGANDAGFEFRSTDTSDTYAPREFLWSGSVWVETTLVLYGLHANRPAANALTPPRTLYVETDRNGVIYQQQANAWHFLAGTMWGTVTPDNRPTDLGANDAGFTYRGTDVARSFVWSGTVWVETTGNVFRNQAVVSGSRAFGTTYRNTNAGPMFVVAVTSLSSVNAAASSLNAYTDSTSPPGTNVDSAFLIMNGANGITINSRVGFMVLPGNYYRVTVSGSFSGLIWTEWW
jgi:hypothetical protein